MRLGGALAAALLATTAQAAEPAAPAGAAACSGCHAPAERATAIPPLEGRPADEIAAAMLDYRSGQRPATVMDRIAKGFTEDEIRAIAAWIAGAR